MTGQNRRPSNRSTATPQAVPTTVGRTSTAVAPCRDSTARPPSTPAATNMALPIGRRRVSRLPAIAATTAITTSTATARNSLSIEPSV